MQGKDAPTRPSLAFSPFPLASKSRQPWSLHSRRLSQSLVHHGRSAAPAWGTLFFLCRDLQQPGSAFFGQKRRLVLAFPAVQRVSHHSHNAPAALRRPGECSFSLHDLQQPALALSVPKAPHGPAFCTSPASSRALRRRAHDFAVKRGPRPGRKEKGPLPSGKGP